jgi:[ribosomal protein S5]-alanine N-acetyltransferase
MFDFTTFPTLTTARLVLREVVAADAPDVFIFRSDPEVQKYNSEPMKDVAEATALIDELQQGYKDQQSLSWGITLRTEPRVLGLCSIHQWDRYHRRAEIGYDLARSQWGQGIGTEAVGAIVRFGFEQLAVHRLEAYTIIDNFASVRMLEKLGFQLEGVRRDYSWEEDGLFHGSGVFGLLRHERGL